MLGLNHHNRGIILAALALLLLTAGEASAYVGPGANLELVNGFTLPLLGYVATSFMAIFVWPIYALFRGPRPAGDAEVRRQPR